MIQHAIIPLACRARALTVEACTTGSTTLARTADGYSRAAGSFVTDGFRVGMEVTPDGFASDTPEVITALTATAMTTDTAHTAQAAASGRTLSVGLPSRRAWENVRFAADQGKPYVEEEYLPGGMTKYTLGAFGKLLATPIYVLRLYGPIEIGRDALALLADALLEHFAPGTPITLSNGDIAEVRGDVAPTVSTLTIDQTWAVVTVSIPLRLYTANSR